jgi:hypothetical protein
MNALKYIERRLELLEVNGQGWEELEYEITLDYSLMYLPLDEQWAVFHCSKEAIVERTDESLMTPKLAAKWIQLYSTIND